MTREGEALAFRAEAGAGEPTRALLRDLDAIAAERAAAEALEAVRWEGLGLDPDLTPAGDFLAWL